MKIKFEPRDIWIGLYWCKGSRVTSMEVDYQIYIFFVCIVPCFPIIIQWNKNIKPQHRGLNW